MGILGAAKDIAALLAGEVFGRILLGAGVFGIFLGGILVYVIVDFTLRWFGVDASTAKLFTLASSAITFILSFLSTIFGIWLLFWVKKKEV